jgi:hypothetical protein
MLHKLRCSLGERKTFPLHRGIVEVDLPEGDADNVDRGR